MTIQQLMEGLWAFVEEEENKRLRFAVNPSILPFRGRPFGLVGVDHERLAGKQIYASQMDQKLQEVGRADVLWFGSNPNAPDSLHRLLWGKKPSEWNKPKRKPKRKFGTRKGPAEFELDYAALSGKGTPQKPVSDTEWDPIGNAKGGWVHYRNGLAGVFDESWSLPTSPEEVGIEPNLNRVVMANAIPWGSHTTDELLKVLFEFDRPLLQRMLEFSDRLVAGMIEALNPKLVIVPLSLARNKTLRQVIRQLGIEYRLALKTQETTNKNRQSETYENSEVSGARTRSFHFYSHRRLGRNCLCVPHPSSLRIPKGAVNNFQAMLTELFKAHLESD